MPDISMFGVTYLQQINEANHPTQGLHIEPGIWANVPRTSDPAEPPTVVRMASIPSQFPSESSGVTQDMVKNPNSVLQRALQTSLQGTSMKSRTFLHVSTANNPIKAGGGTANTAFLASSHNPPLGNARAAQVQATFWIETIAGTGGNPDIHQLQYTQLVTLDFNGIHWPHVTVGTLRKQ